MAVDTGFEPVLLKSKFSVLPLHQSTITLVAVERIELSSNAYETSVLTIKLYSNKLVSVLRIELRFTG